MTAIFSRFFKKKATKKPGPTGKGAGSPTGRTVNDEELINIKISENLKENFAYLKDVLGGNVDVVFREFRLGWGGESACLVYLSNMVDEDRISRNILRPLMLRANVNDIDRPPGNAVEMVKGSILTATELYSAFNMQDIIKEILYGGIAIFIDGSKEAIIVVMKAWPQRQVEKADVEGVVRGSKESFTENIGVNISLIRRRLRTPNLVIEGLNLGRITNTSVTVVYLKGVVSPALVREVKQRLSRIDIDGILEGGYIEELIQDDPYSPFPQISYSERPDRVVGGLLQGKVCVFTDGTPLVLFMPISFQEMLQNPEDYYERYHFATVVRILRFLGLLVSLLLPSFYIAVITFHHEMMPTQLLIGIAAFREGVPFPALVEALLMEITFEALREAGLRLPRVVGQAVSIVGALVIGQAAVQAGIVSPLMVIVVAVTGIASFMIPAYNLTLTIRLLRFPLMILAATLGLFGVMSGVLALLIHMTGLRSFGVPYLAPLAPLKISDLKDSIIRVPWWAMHERPSELAKRNVRRVAPDLKPHPPSGEEAAVDPGHAAGSGLNTKRGYGAGRQSSTGKARAGRRRR